MEFFTFEVEVGGEIYDGPECHVSIRENEMAFSRWMDGQSQMAQLELRYGMFNPDDGDVETPGPLEILDCNGEPLTFMNGDIDLDAIEWNVNSIFYGWAGEAQTDGDGMMNAYMLDAATFQIQIQGKTLNDAANILLENLKQYFCFEDGEISRFAICTYHDGYKKITPPINWDFKICPKCWFAADEHESFCTECGTELSTELKFQA